MKLVAIVSGLIFLVFSCGRSVWTSDYQTNPGALKVNIKIQQYGESDRVVVFSFLDGDGKAISLDGGKVMVNGALVKIDRHEALFAQENMYRYYPERAEEFFQVSIFWNDKDSYSFIIDQNSGFPGFVDSIVSRASDRQSRTKEKGDFCITPAPFYKARVNVEYELN